MISWMRGGHIAALVWLQVYDEPTVLLAKRVTGEEEVPEGCVAVVTPDAPDVLSHVSVRARNMRVLFAICHEAQPLADIEKLASKVGSRGICPSHLSAEIADPGAYLMLLGRDWSLVLMLLTTYPGQPEFLVF